MPNNSLRFKLHNVCIKKALGGKCQMKNLILASEIKRIYFKKFHLTFLKKLASSQICDFPKHDHICQIFMGVNTCTEPHVWKQVLLVQICRQSNVQWTPII